ncbi:MGMT family protein [Aquibacillus kalidii]|uniref:MGMT family protein n=1 Tax=Aquibacillus kalidii TaxID=2762597 RepID=UPI001648833F|nr:MGMT family protein [Aquibacillus kalidii]
MEIFTENVLSVVKAIPFGKVMTYGQVATLAGNPRAARQVARILHSMSEKYSLPWYRVINRLGEISLSGEGLQSQKYFLENEGITVKDDIVDLEKYQFRINSMDINN